MKSHQPEVPPRRPDAVLPITDTEDEVKSDKPVDKSIRKNQKRKLKEANERTAAETPAPAAETPVVPKKKSNRGVEQKGASKAAAEQFLAPDAPLDETQSMKSPKPTTKPNSAESSKEQHGLQVD